MSSQKGGKPHSKKASASLKSQQHPSQEIDEAAIEKMYKEQEALDAELQQDEVDRKIMNQEEVDDMINAEEE